MRSERRTENWKLAVFFSICKSIWNQYVTRVTWHHGVTWCRSQENEIAYKCLMSANVIFQSQCHCAHLSLSLPYPILSPVLDLTAPSSLSLSPHSQSRGYPGQGVRICPGHVKLNGMCRSSWDADCSQSGQTNFGSAQWHAGIMFCQVSVTESLSGSQSCIVRLGKLILSVWVVS